MGPAIHPLDDLDLVPGERAVAGRTHCFDVEFAGARVRDLPVDEAVVGKLDRKSTRLNSSHQIISYAVFCLKKKKSKDHNSSSSEHLTSGRTEISTVIA